MRFPIAFIVTFAFSVSSCLETSNSNSNDGRLFGENSSGGQSSGGVDSVITFEQLNQAVQANCSGCHSGGSNVFNSDLATEQEYLDAGYIEPGFPNSSRFYTCLTGPCGSSTPMETYLNSDTVDSDSIAEYIRNISASEN